MKFRLFSIMLLFFVFSNLTYAREKEVKEKYFTASNGEKFKIQATFTDNNNDGVFDWVLTEIYHWDGKKWYRSGGTSVPIKKVYTSQHSSDDERIELCNSISKPDTEMIISIRDSTENFPYISTSSYNLYFFDSNDANVGYLEITETEAILSGYFTQEIPEASDMRLLVNGFFPNDPANYTYKDLKLTINELVTNNYVDVNLGAFMARVLAKIEFYNINNELVKTENINNRQVFSIDVNDLPNSTYLIRFLRIDNVYYHEDSNILINR